jgi:hypothetical protein
MAEFTAKIHGGFRKVRIVASNAERVLYEVRGLDDGKPYHIPNCCMSPAGFARRFGEPVGAT